jgi:hypothetical protein
MRRSPSIASSLPDDVDVYLVLDDFGQRLGLAWRETDEADTDRATTIQDLIDGQYRAPVRVVAFNTAEGWARDVSEDIADELRNRINSAYVDVPSSLEGFLERYADGRPMQLPLPLKGAA